MVVRRAAWLDFLIRKIYYDQKEIKLITPGDYLEIYPKNQVSLLPSSWGYKGLTKSGWKEQRLDLPAPPPDHPPHDRTGPALSEASGNLRRALNQAAREALLAQSSDWAFIMKTGTMVQYAVKRTKDHIGRFLRLYDEIISGRINEDFLRDLEEKDNLFPIWITGSTPQPMGSRASHPVEAIALAQ